MNNALKNLSLTEKKMLASDVRQTASSNYNSILDNIKNTDTFLGTDKTSLGFYDPVLNTSYLTNTNPYATTASRLSSAIHEVGSHAALQGDKRIPSQMQESLIESFLPKNRLLEISNNPSDPLRFAAGREARLPYLTNPAEVHARILETRLNSGKFPQGQLTWEDFQNATNVGILDPNFTKLILNPARFVKNANKYAAGLPVIPALNNQNNK